MKPDKTAAEGTEFHGIGKKKEELLHKHTTENEQRVALKVEFKYPMKLF